MFLVAFYNLMSVALLIWHSRDNCSTFRTGGDLLNTTETHHESNLRLGQDVNIAGLCNSAGLFVHFPDQS